MFKLLKTFFWIIAILFITYYIAGFFGYQFNRQYFTYSKKECEKKLKDCSNNLIHKGIDNAQCNLQCINPSLIIKKKK